MKYFKNGLISLISACAPHARTGATFYVVGSHADEEILSLHSEAGGICIKGFVSEEELEALYAQVRVVAVPLLFGAGVKGKVIEALYFGCPVMTTTTGAEGIPDAETVMTVSDEAGAMAEELIRMYNDTERLDAMSAAALKYVRAHHGPDAVWDIIKDDFA